MDMVERVKLAIRDAAVQHKDGRARSMGYYLGVGIDYFKHDYGRYEELLSLAAVAAIAAVREPTDAACPPSPVERG